MIKRSIHTREFTLLMALLMSVVAISIDALLPALGLLGKELGVTNANQTQLVIGFIFGGMALGELIAGPLSDAIGRKPVLYIGLGFYLVGSICCYWANDFDFLLIGRFIQGFGGASPYVTVMSVVRDKYKGRDMARIMSLVMMIFILAPAIAPSLGQAALLIHRPSTFSSPDGPPFWAAIPAHPAVYWPVFALTVAISIVASQALISAAFSIVKQGQSGFMPRLQVVHTSKHHEGQIYIPAINWVRV